MPGDEAEETVRVLAREYGVTIQAEHLGEVAAAWRLMAPHLDRVRAADLGPELEPASLFRP
ncbi:MAG: hypothetical protein ABIO37_15315 [Caulobacteraceae bacterium]